MPQAGEQDRKDDSSDKDISICPECMQRTMDMMNGGNVDYSRLDFSKMPNISMINLSDLQNMIPKRQKVKKKAPDRQEKAEKVFDIRSIPAPHKIKESLDEYVIGQEKAKKNHCRCGIQPL